LGTITLTNVGGGAHQALITRENVTITNAGTIRFAGIQGVYGQIYSENSQPNVQLINRGLIEKAGDANTTGYINAELDQEATGSLSILAGDFYLTNAPTQVSNLQGNLTGSVDARLIIEGGQVEFASNSSVSVPRVRFFRTTADILGTWSTAAGTSSDGSNVDFLSTSPNLGDVSISNSTLSFSGGAGSTAVIDDLQLPSGVIKGSALIVVNGQFVINGGTVGATGEVTSLESRGSMLISAGSVRDAILTNKGTALWSSGTLQFFGSVGGFVNAAGATFTNTFDGIFGSVDNNCLEFVNEGLFVKTGGSGITYLQMLLYNRGTVDIQQGQLFLGCGYATNRIEPPCTNCVVTGPPEFRDPPGDDIDHPLVIPGNYRQTVNGALSVNISSFTPPGTYGVPGVDYGQLIVTGNVTLAGTFGIQLVGGFVPSANQKYMVIDNRGSQPIEGNFIGLLQGQSIPYGNYSFRVSYDGGDGNDVVLTVFQNNSSPTASAGGTYTISEGDSLTLDASGSVDPDGDSLSYSWDLNGDSDFTDATGVAPTVLWSALEVLGIRDGVSQHAVQVRVSDGVNPPVESAITILTVNNAAPTVQVSASVDGFDGVTGQTRSYNLTAIDPSSVDQAADFTYLINWGDGSPIETIVGQHALVAAHVYATLGNYVIAVQATDKDGGSRTATRGVTIRTSELQGTTMAVGGTAANDAYTISRNADGTTRVQRGTLVLPSFVMPAGGINVFGFTGTDTLLINGTGDIESFEISQDVVLWNTSRIQGNSIESRTVNGQGGNDSFLYLSGSATIDGGAGSDALIGPDFPSTWNISASNQGSVANASFIRVENLTGGSNEDQFRFSATGALSGRIDGGAGIDQLDYSLRTSPLTINLATNTASGTTGIANLEQFVGTALASSTFTGPNIANLWEVSGENQFVLNQSYEALAFNNVTGGTASDRFEISPTGRITGSVNGGGGSDTISYEQWSEAISFDLGLLTSTAVGKFASVETFIGGQSQLDQFRGNNVNTTWTIDGSHTGLVGAIRFEAIELLSGGNQVDSFRLTSSESVVSAIDGGAGIDTLSSLSEQNVWELTGLQSGTLNSQLQFSAVESLVGGTQDDIFKFMGGSGFQSINGGAALTADTLDYSFLGTPVVIDLSSSTATFVTGFVGIERFVGTNGNNDQLQGRNANQTWAVGADGNGSVGANQFVGFERILGGTANDTLVMSAAIPAGLVFEGGLGTDSLVGPNAATTWLIDSTGGGSLGTLLFSNIENLTGGTNHDWFKVSEAGRILGNLNGGAGDNSLDYSQWNANVDVNLATRVGTAVTGTITNIAILLGGSGSDLLVASGASSVLVGNGGVDRLVGGSGRNVLIGGMGGDRIEGLGGDDLIVSGRTAFDNDANQLRLILAEWKSTRTYDQRIANLTGNGALDRANANVFLGNTPEDTVFGDEGAVDELLGGTGRDWFFADLEDQLLDRVSVGINAERVDQA
ncbi:MAG: PKD domain-containing protein, partial [Pirellulaceae bacterium]|nr:PKD domain-containing protein [Pirellulaceae bacterium]